jgi:hypothetical protein
LYRNCRDPNCQIRTKRADFGTKQGDFGTKQADSGTAAVLARVLLNRLAERAHLMKTILSAAMRDVLQEYGDDDKPPGPPGRAGNFPQKRPKKFTFPLDFPLHSA